MAIDNTSKLFEFLSGLVDDTSLISFASCGESFSTKSTNTKWKEGHNKGFYYSISFRGGAFGESPVIVNLGYFRPYNEDELTMRIIAAMVKNSAYYIDWEKRKIRKKMEALGI
jgi:hypothetical protein